VPKNEVGDHLARGPIGQYASVDPHPDRSNRYKISRSFKTAEVSFIHRAITDTGPPCRVCRTKCQRRNPAPFTADIDVRPPRRHPIPGHRRPGCPAISQRGAPRLTAHSCRCDPVAGIPPTGRLESRRRWEGPIKVPPPPKKKTPRFPPRQSSTHRVGAPQNPDFRIWDFGGAWPGNRGENHQPNGSRGFVGKCNGETGLGGSHQSERNRRPEKNEHPAQRAVTGALTGRGVGSKEPPARANSPDNRARRSRSAQPGG